MSSTSMVTAARATVSDSRGGQGSSLPLRINTLIMNISNQKLLRLLIGKCFSEPFFSHQAQYRLFTFHNKYIPPHQAGTKDYIVSPELDSPPPLNRSAIREIAKLITKEQLGATFHIQCLIPEQVNLTMLAPSGGHVGEFFESGYRTKEALSDEYIQELDFLVLPVVEPKSKTVVGALTLCNQNGAAFEADYVEQLWEFSSRLAEKIYSVTPRSR
ncbi:hypothetical protein ACFL52_03105 [Candidatus Margulisiibacteriota bacterium]